MIHDQRATITATLRWLLIRQQEGQEPLSLGLEQLQADVDHSGLLPRLLEGKEPLPAPPPGGAYQLIENGYALLSQYDVSWLRNPGFSGLEPGDNVWVFGSIWRVVGRLSEHSVEVSYPDSRCAPGRWRLTYIGDTFFGAQIVERNGETFGEPWSGPGWVLRRFED